MHAMNRCVNAWRYRPFGGFESSADGVSGSSNIAQETAWTRTLEETGWTTNLKETVWIPIPRLCWDSSRGATFDQLPKHTLSSWSWTSPSTDTKPSSSPHYPELNPPNIWDHSSTSTRSQRTPSEHDWRKSPVCAGVRTVEEDIHLDGQGHEDTTMLKKEELQQGRQARCFMCPERRKPNSVLCKVHYNIMRKRLCS